MLFIILIFLLNLFLFTLLLLLLVLVFLLLLLLSDFIGLFKEVLRDDGVNGGFVFARSPYDDTDSAGFATRVGDAGVWCVTQAKSSGE